MARHNAVALTGENSAVGQDLTVAEVGFGGAHCGLMTRHPRNRDKTVNDLPTKSDLQIGPGDIYEDCAFHPVVCVEVDVEEDSISEISMIDGSHPRNCSLRFCGIRKLTIDEARQIRLGGPLDERDREQVPVDKRWWRE